MNRDQMRIKSYFAKSVDLAMAQAREELGPEAMLLNTRKAPPDQIEGGGYEVIFGVAGESIAVPSIVAPVTAAPVEVAETRLENSAPEHFTAELTSARSNRRDSEPDCPLLTSAAYGRPQCAGTGGCLF
jgi:flagellar biosynthesis GTPase FlhF